MRWGREEGWLSVVGGGDFRKIRMKSAIKVRSLIHSYFAEIPSEWASGLDGDGFEESAEDLVGDEATTECELPAVVVRGHKAFMCEFGDGGGAGRNPVVKEFGEALR